MLTLRWFLDSRFRGNDGLGYFATPSQAGIQKPRLRLFLLDSRLRGNDVFWREWAKIDTLRRAWRTTFRDEFFGHGQKLGK